MYSMNNYSFTIQGATKLQRTKAIIGLMFSWE
jgi:hypothetical protein